MQTSGGRERQWYRPLLHVPAWWFTEVSPKEGCDPGVAGSAPVVWALHSGVSRKDVRDAAAADVDGLRGHVGEDDAGGVDAPGGRLGADARLAVGREAQQPQHRLRHAVQDLAPGREGLRVVLHTGAACVKDVQRSSSDTVP